MASTLDYSTLIGAAKQIDYAKEMPEELPEGWKDNEFIVKKVF